MMPVRPLIYSRLAPNSFRPLFPQGAWRTMQSDRISSFPTIDRTAEGKIAFGFTHSSVLAIVFDHQSLDPTLAL